MKKEETSGLWSGSINVKTQTFNTFARECPFIRPQECRPRGRGTVLGPAIKVKIYESRNLGRDNVVVGEWGGGRPKERVTLEKRLLPPRTLTAQVVSWFIKILSGPSTGKINSTSYLPSVLKYIIRFPYIQCLQKYLKGKVSRFCLL